MDEMDAHKAHATKLLSEAGAPLSSATAAAVDPELANAQAATNALNTAAVEKVSPLPPAAQVIENVATRDPAAEQAGFFAQTHREADTQALAQRQLAEHDARNMGPPAAMASATVPGTGGPDDLITSPADLQVHAAQLRDRGMRNAQIDGTAASKIAAATGIVDKEQAAVEKPFVDQLAKQSEASMASLQKYQADIETQQQQKMAHYETVQAEMSKMAMEQPKDLMGQAGVNSILGHIAIFLGGAGVNGFHENKALSMIQSMADRNVAAQKNRYEMLNRVGQGDQSMYGMLTQKLQSKVAVEAALRTGYMETYAAHLKAVGNQFADKRTNLRVQTLQAGIQEHIHQETQKVQTDYQNTSTGAIQLYNSELLAQSKAMAEAQALELKKMKFAQTIDKEQYQRDEKVKETSFLGIKGTSSKEEHPKLAEVWGGAYNMVQNLDEAQKIMRADKTFANARAYEALKNINLGEAKKYFNTGARLEPKEVAMMEAVGISYPQYAEALMYNGGVGLTGTQIAEGMKGIQWLIAHNAFTSLKAGHPQFQIDTDDPVVGRFFGGSAQAEPKWRAEATKNYGTDKGSALLQTMPDYNTAYPNSTGE